MRRTLSSILVIAGIALATHALAGPKGDAGDDKKKDELTCVKSWAEVRARAYGYDHIVHLDNGCTKRARCAVSTDVNPEVTTVELDPKEQREVLTWMGSPASTFVPSVHCTGL